MGFLTATMNEIKEKLDKKEKKKYPELHYEIHVDFPKGEDFEEKDGRSYNAPSENGKHIFIWTILGNLILERKNFKRIVEIINKDFLDEFICATTRMREKDHVPPCNYKWEKCPIETVLE